MDGVFQKATQLVHALATDAEGECPYCRIQFGPGHTCPVAMQLAEVLLNLDSDTDRRLHCDICQTAHDDPWHFWNHLRHDHHLKLFDFVPPRDSMGGEAICSHCHNRYTTFTGLRCHIVYGRCNNFNPHKDSVEKELDPAIMKSMWDGSLIKLLQDPELTLRLTTHCECCEREFERSIDLASPRPP